MSARMPDGGPRDGHRLLWSWSAAARRRAGGPGALQPRRPAGAGCPWRPRRDRGLFRSEAAAYGGGRREAGPVDELAPFEFIVFGPPSWRAFPE